MESTRSSTEKGRQKRMSRHSVKLDNLLKYLTAAILLVIPLYPKFPFINIPGTYVSIRFEDFVIALAGLVLIKLIINDYHNFFNQKINKAIIFYLLVGLTSLASGIFVTETVLPHLGFYHFLRRIEYFIPFFLGLYALNRKSNLEFFFKVISVALITSFIYGVGQRYFDWPIIVTQNLEYSQGVALRYISGSHINSTFAGHYDLGTYLVLLLPVFICLFFLLKEVKTRLFLLIIVSAGLWLLSYSGSRISVFSYLVSSGLALIIIKKYREIILVYIFSLLFFSMSQNLISRYLRIIEVTTQKIIGAHVIQDFYNLDIYAQTQSFPEKRVLPSPTPTPPPVFEDRSTSIRLNVEWPRALRAFAKNPLLGLGFSSITLATDNDFLRLLGEVGLVGFLAFALIFLGIAKKLRSVFPLSKNFKGVELGFMAGICGSLPGIFINAFLLDVFEASKFATIFWLVMGMVVILAQKAKYE